MPYLSIDELPAVGEDVDINITFTANANTGVISSVVASLDEAINGNIVITVGTPSGANGNTVISISGRYNDNFDKTITYEDGNKAVQTTTRFKNITPGYNFISEYLAASGGTVTATYSINIDGTPITLDQTINNTSYTPGQNYLVQYVAQGKY